MENELNLKLPTIFHDLKKTGNVIPTPVYWTDLNGVIKGANKHCLTIVGNLAYEEMIEKTPYDYYPEEKARSVEANVNKVIETGQTIAFEESVSDLTTGKIRYYIVTRAPLFENEKIVGTVGAITEITAEKEAVRLNIENEAHKAQLQEQEKFSQVVNQVAHDIRSPLSALLMTLKSCSEIPEQQRIALREAAISITDITNNLLQQYKFKELESPNKIEESESVLCSATLLQILTEKKYQYQELPVKINHDFSQAGHFAFVQIGTSAFRRMISNLVNNAVDALERQDGKVLLKLDADKEFVKIIIEDDGKGMPLDVLNKILNKMSVTDGKQDGKGLGMMQVNETLKRFNGKISIQSICNKGTQISLHFPRTQSPNWIAEKIKLDKQDIVVILDDDTSIHNAWDTHFKSILKIEPSIQLKHFEMGQEAIDFIQNLNPDEKNKISLLTDYELLKQNLNGLDVIAQTKIQRSILVTSHYAKKNLQEQAVKIGTRILPKQMASEVRIKINSSELESTTEHPHSKKVHLVLVEDDGNFASSIKNYLEEVKKSTVDCYSNPYDFLRCLHEYPKDTKISLDNDFHLPEMDGLKLAEQLYEQGYTNLYMLSGKEFSAEQIPHYITFIMKTDLDRIGDL